MTSSRRSNVVRDLEGLVKVAGPDASGTLGPFLRDHARDIARELDIAEETLVEASGSSDEHVYPALVTALREWRERRGERRDAELAEKARCAAERLGATAIWNDTWAELRRDLLFGDVLVDASKKYVRFASDDLDVAIHRRKLFDTARVVNRFRGVTVFVDARGLHIRWREGRGQLNFLPQLVLPRDHDHVLVVPLARKKDLNGLAFIPASPRVPMRQPALLGDILADLGFG